MRTTSLKCGPRYNSCTQQRSDSLELDTLALSGIQSSSVLFSASDWLLWVVYCRTKQHFCERKGLAFILFHTIICSSKAGVSVFPSDNRPHSKQVEVSIYSQLDAMGCQLWVESVSTASARPVVHVRAEHVECPVLAVQQSLEALPVV